MDCHLRSVAIMIEVTSRHTESTHVNPDYSRMPAVTQHSLTQFSQFKISLRIPETVAAIATNKTLICTAQT